MRRGWVEGLQTSFGLPGRDWAKSPRAGALGLVAVLVVLAVGVLVGPSAFAALDAHRGLCVALGATMLWAGVNPIDLSRSGTGIELVLEGGVFAIAALTLGPEATVAFWLAATLGVELLQRHYVALALLNTALTLGAAALGVTVLQALPAPHGDAGHALVGAAVATAYAVAEAALTEVVLRYLVADWRGGFPWVPVGIAAGNGIALGAVGGLAVAELGGTKAAVALAIPLVLASRLTRVEALRQRALASSREVIASVTRLASVDSHAEVERVVLESARRISTASTITLHRGEQDRQDHRVRWYALRDHDGQGPRWLRAEMLPLKARVAESEVEGLQHLVAAAGVAHDRIADRESMHHAAQVDQLTGLLNRHGFWARSADPVPPGTREGVLVIDLDEFKPVNDRFGHRRGDDVLRAVAAALCATAPAGARVVRWGGDEFVIHLVGRPELPDLAELGDRVIAAVEESARLLARDVPVSASVGWAQTPGSGPRGVVDLLHLADEQMYAAKRAGKSTVRGA